METGNVENVGEICNICQNKQDVVALSDNNNVINLLKSCVNVQVSSDRFLCNSCVNKLKEWQEFKGKIEKAFGKPTQPKKLSTIYSYMDNKENIPPNQQKVKKLKAFSCWECQDGFENKKALVGHLLKKHPNVAKCKFCTQIFRTEVKLRHHMEYTCPYIQRKQKKNVQSLVQTRTKYLVAAAIQTKINEDCENEITNEKEHEIRFINEPASPSYVFTNESSPISM